MRFTPAVTEILSNLETMLPSMAKGKDATIPPINDRDIVAQMLSADGKGVSVELIRSENIVKIVVPKGGDAKAIYRIPVTPSAMAA